LGTRGCRHGGNRLKVTSTGRWRDCGNMTELVVFSDVASGLSERRAGLGKALGECMKPGVDRLVVEHPGRLARLGVGLIEHLLAGYGVSVVYTGQSQNESAESELVGDMVAIVTSFAGRLCGRRSEKRKRLPAAVSAETECGDAA
jgi:putative resolvase